MEYDEIAAKRRKMPRAAKPQPKAGGNNRGIREIRGTQTSSRFAFRVFGVFRGSRLFALLINFGHYPKVLCLSGCLPKGGTAGSRLLRQITQGAGKPPKAISSQLQAMCLGGGCDMQARYMRHTSQVQARYKPPRGHRANRATDLRGIVFREVGSPELVRLWQATG